MESELILFVCSICLHFSVLFIVGLVFSAL